MTQVFGTEVYGEGVDAATRCAHYHSWLDIIAIRFACCDRWYPCHLCHEAVAGHSAVVWPADRFDEDVVLCGACGHRMSANAYFASGHACPACGHLFNPGCETHRHLYFETADLLARGDHRARIESRLRRV